MKADHFYLQSYNDALNDYIYSCANLKSKRWDWIILTASNERQAKVYQIQIDKRRKEKRLPMGTQFCVVHDYENKRIGSGGATLNVIRYIAEKIGIEQLCERKALIIHSGGDSKRIPQYSACGKIFAPVPRILPGGYSSTIFDELIIAFTDVPNRCGKGIMFLPSDTQILFNSLQLDLISCDAAGLSVKAPVLEGQDHGVFLQSEESCDHRNKNVARFLHKQSEVTLRKYGAVDDYDQVNIDTGCIWFGNKLIKELFNLISTGGIFDQAKFDKFVNPKVCLNFYADFVYPLASESTQDDFYEETPENGYSAELKECRKEIWKRLHNYKLSLVKMIPAQYIHFGITNEMYSLLVNNIKTYAFLGWNPRILTNANKGTVINSYVSNDSIVPDDCYIENCIITNSIVGNGTILSNINADNLEIPSGIVMHALKLNNNKYVCRIYGKNDNPKASYTASFMGSSLLKVIKSTGIDMGEVWNKSTPSIWNACLYPECDTLDAAVKSALSLYHIVIGEVDCLTIETWKKSKKYSLANSFSEADISAVLNRQYEITQRVKMENFISDIDKNKDMSEVMDQLDLTRSAAKNFVVELKYIADKSLFPQNMRLYLACADICKKYALAEQNLNYDLFENYTYDAICKTIIKATFERFRVDYKLMHFVKEEEIVELPVRVNFCGSPSDAAPYCLEHGGTMIDGALLLNGKRPVKVTVRKIIEKKIRCNSLDQDCTASFTEIKDVRNCSNPFDPYALHKAVLVATGIIPFDTSGTTVKMICEQLGGGIEITTEVDVPKGSGLGTSSIIAAAAVKAVNTILGIAYTEEMIYAQVFLIEQLMNTGGGWQDQVGGFTNGIKYFTSKPGKYQKIEVECLTITEEIKKELNERFALIFSGQRRLARNVLRAEMNQCIRNNKDVIHAISDIQECCAVMRYYLLKGDITSFAKCITKQFELVKRIDKGASNACIEYIFDVCDDLLDGRSICGAGGGGFLQVILKKGVTKKMLTERIQDAFMDCGVNVWESQLI